MSETKRYEDHLNRKKLAGQVLDTLLQQTHVKVMSLNGGWGSGKTYFLDFMREHAKTKGILFITHNVWENDYLDNPFLSIMAELLEQLGKHKSLFTKTQELSFEILKSAYNRLHSAIQLEATGKVGASLPYLLKLVGVDVEANLEAKVDVVKLLLPPKAELKDYEVLKQAKKEFKQELSKIIEGLPHQKLIIAIDEVDRTRPEYAIRTLEVIKHFFDIDGLKFILAVDKKQLQNTVKQMFGQDTETDCYLRKFVDLEWNLPSPDLTIFLQAQFEANHFKDVFLLHNVYLYCISDKRVDCYTSKNQDRLLKKASDILVSFFEETKMSLRDIEKFLIYLKITLQNIPKETHIAFEVLLELLYLNKKHTEVFQKSHQKLDGIITNKKSNPIKPIDPVENQKSYYEENLKGLYEQSHAYHLQRLFHILLNSQVELWDCNWKPYSMGGWTNDEKQYVAGKTLLHYYQAIQFAGGFNSDD